jgi:xanthine dehydrogenase accessory factor
VRCPIGHDNGGDSPQEIAISIASQLLATYHGRE